MLQTNIKPFSLYLTRINFSCIIFSTLAIFAGGFIYILFRPLEADFFQSFHFLGLDSWISAIRESIVGVSRIFPEWFVYSLPNGLWSFSYSLIITVIWCKNKSAFKYFWMYSIPVLVLGFEILQLMGIIRGTFSAQDIFLGVTGMMMGFLLARLLIKIDNYEKN